MIRAAAVWLLLLLAVPAAAAQPEWSFASPAQFEGDVVLEGAWVLLALDHGADAEISMRDVTYTNVTNGWLWHKTDTPVHYSEVGYDVHPVERERSMDAVEARASFGANASLYVRADAVRLALHDAAGNVEAVREGQRIDDGHEWDVAPDAYRAVRAQAPAGIGVSGRLPGGTFTLEAEGLREVEWHGAHVTCASADCPDGANTHRRRADTGASGTAVVTSHYTVLEGSGTLQASGGLVAAFGGARVVDLDIAGTARLPVARAAASCGCADPGGSTVTTEGNLSLERLRAQSSRMHATVSGDPEALRFDETPVDPDSVFAPVDAAVAVVAAAGVLALLWKIKPLVSVLVTRMQRPRVLQHRNRRLLYDVVVEDPGIHFRALVRRLDIAAGTARHHLNVLIRNELVFEVVLGATVCFFEDTSTNREACRRLVVLRDGDLKRLHGFVQENPGIIQKDVLDATSTWGWKRSTTQHRLKRLVSSGILQVRWSGRAKRYFDQEATPEVPDASSAREVPAWDASKPSTHARRVEA